MTKPNNQDDKIQYDNKKIDLSQLQGRKTEHIRICVEENVEAETIRPGFQDLRFVHRALPNINYDDIDVTCTLFGKKLSAPIIISAMTGGKT